MQLQPVIVVVSGEDLGIEEEVEIEEIEEGVGGVVVIEAVAEDVAEGERKRRNGSQSPSSVVL